MEQKHIYYCGSIHKVGGSLSIKKYIKTVAGVVVREFVARFGCPLEMHTDQWGISRVNSLKRFVNC